MRKKDNKFHITWKRNFRRMPEPVRLKVRSLPKDDLVVGCVKRIPKADIAAGKYAHLQLRLDGDTLAFPNRLVPDRQVGIYSRANIEGKEIVRKDLPMTTKEYSWDTPNFGDWSLGTHTVYRDRYVYQRDFISPKELEIEIELLAEDVVPASVFVLRFRVHHVLNRRSKGFQEELFFALNLLQENVGLVDVFASDAILSDYLATVHVAWEILPPGEREATIARILTGMRTPTEEIRKKLIQRYNLLAGLKPVAFIQGTSGFRRYFGAKFSDHLIAFENLDYGNAIYVMFEAWEELSKKSRLELLAGNRDGFVRIVHSSGWESKLRRVVRDKR